MTKCKLSWLLLAVIPASFACFMAFLLISEWVRIGIIADPKVIEEYYFGGEAMMAHGGWQYRTATTYASTALIEGLFLLALGLFTLTSSIRSNSRNTAIGVSLIFIWFLIRQLSIWVL